MTDEVDIWKWMQQHPFTTWMLLTWLTLIFLTAPTWA